MAKPATEVDNVMDNIPFYDKWQLGEGIPIIRTFFVQDLKKIELKPWARTGGNGAFINMEGARRPSGMKKAPSRHSNGKTAACSPCRSTPHTSTSMVPGTSRRGFSRS